MRLKLYRAPRMADAMARLRTELGPEALILATRRVADGVEITAALEAEPAPAPDPARMPLLHYHGVPSELHPALSEGPLEAALQALLPFSVLPLGAADTILVAGPPGAGKTLTVARLATRLVLGGAKPLVISTDGKRAGAAEQLAAFTRLLGIELTLANTPVSLARALARKTAAAPVLIDSPGTDPFDLAQREEIAALAATASAVVALVLPAGLDPEESTELGAAYAKAGATLLIATRLDLARRLGGIVAAAAAGRLALAEAGVSAAAADGLVPLTPAFLATRLAGPPA